LSTEKNWKIKKVEIDNVVESRGINTPEDLDYFRDLYAKENSL